MHLGMVRATTVLMQSDSRGIQRYHKQTASLKTYDNSELQQLLSNLSYLSLVYCIHFIKIYIYILLYFFACLLHTHRRNHTYIHFVKTVA